jgi:DNA-binding LacI/PurR family transcriptional regulator
MPTILERRRKTTARDEQPKYRSLADQLRAQIASRALQPGDRLPSFSEMRTHFGVTSTTVERVYGLLEQEGLIERQPRRGLFVAERKNALTGNIGISSGADLRSFSELFYAHLTRGLQGAAEREERRLLWLNTSRDWSQDSFKDIDGLLLSGHSPEMNRKILLHKPPHLPAVSLFVMAEGIGSVVADDYRGARLAVEHLVALGHRRIACLMEEQPLVARRRLAGYRDALLDAGLATDARRERLAPSRTRTPDAPRYLDWGRDQMRAWLQDDWKRLKCTALLVQNDTAAIGVMQELQRAGIKVPGAVSVMGFDGTELCDYVMPHLCSVRLPLEEMGSKAMELLIGHISGSRIEEQTIVLPVSLRDGDSVAPR